MLSYGAKFVSMDKYGLDAGAENGAAADPAHSTWFWNADHWNNYLLFSKTLHEATNLPVTLWQLPVGHINGSTSSNPYTGGTFADQANTSQHYEDSAPSFFFGDSFNLSGSRLAYFSTNAGNDPKVTVSGNTVTWGSHMAEAAASRDQPGPLRRGGRRQHPRHRLAAERRILVDHQGPTLLRRAGRAVGPPSCSDPSAPPCWAEPFDEIETTFPAYHRIGRL